MLKNVGPLGYHHWIGLPTKDLFRFCFFFVPLLFMQSSIFFFFHVLEVFYWREKLKREGGALSIPKLRKSFSANSSLSEGIPRNMFWRTIAVLHVGPPARVELSARWKRVVVRDPCWPVCADLSDPVRACALCRNAQLNDATWTKAK